MSHIDEGVLEAYLDGETEEEERREVERHLETCIECRERLVEVTTLSRSVSELLAELEPGPVQPPPWRELEERAVERLTIPGRRFWLRPGLAWAASLFLAFSIGWFSGSFRMRSPAPAYEVADRAEAPAARLDHVEKKEDRASMAEGNIGRELEKQAADKPLALEEQLGGAVEDEASAMAFQSRPESAATASAEGVAAVAAETELDDRDGSIADTELEQGSAGEIVPAEEESRLLAELEAGAEGAELRSQLEEVRPESAAPTRPKMRAAQPPPAPEPTPPTADFVISIATDPDDAASRLGGPLRMLPDLDLQRVEVVPGSGVEGGLDHLPVVKMVYLDAAGHEIVLLQQLLSPGDRARVPAEPTLVVQPSGLKSYRWRDSEGYLLILWGEVSSDSLRSLADLVR
jgi:anti-sigma factor RsiW